MAASKWLIINNIEAVATIEQNNMAPDADVITSVSFSHIHTYTDIYIYIYIYI